MTYHGQNVCLNIKKTKNTCWVNVDKQYMLMQSNFMSSVYRLLAASAFHIPLMWSWFSISYAFSWVYCFVTLLSVLSFYWFMFYLFQFIIGCCHVFPHVHMEYLSPQVCYVSLLLCIVHCNRCVVRFVKFKSTCGFSLFSSVYLCLICFQ